MNIDQISSDFKKIMPGCVIGSVLDAGDEYIVSLTKKNLPKDVYVMDTMFTYNKQNRHIFPFIVGQNTDMYKKALNHVVYRRPK